jgi:hypothetical protein
LIGIYFYTIGFKKLPILIWLCLVYGVNTTFNNMIWLCHLYLWSYNIVFFSIFMVLIDWLIDYCWTSSYFQDKKNFNDI